ncbi:MAG: winged helix-turn-helix transcriptional regulator [Nitrososphaeraceae archaeon]
MLTKRLCKIITKRGTLDILIPLCYTTTPVKFTKLRNTKGFSNKTLAKRLKELDESGILERRMLPTKEQENGYYEL